MRLLAALCALCVAGCDLPTDPVPTNPYDPLFDGTRIASAPDELQLESSSGTSLTVRWADPSSFETGFRVERRLSPLPDAFVPVATLGPNVTEFTDTGITNGQDRQYRVVTLAAGETDSGPSPVLLARRRREAARIGALAEVSQTASSALFSPDGSRAYVFTGTTAFAVDPRDGSVDGTLIGAVSPIAALADGRIVALREATATSVPVGIYDGAAIEAVVALSPSSDAACPQLVPASVRLSANAQTFAGLCSTPGADSRTVAVWGAAGGAPARLLTASGVRAVSIDLSPDGTRISVAATATASGGRDASVLDTRSGAVVWSARDASRLAGIPLRFSPDGQRLLDPGPADVRLLDASTGVAVAVQPGVTSRGGAASFAPDGRSVALVTSQGNGAVAVLRTSDLAVTSRILEVETRGLRLLAGDVVLILRVSPQGSSDPTLLRLDPQAPWEAVPTS